MLYGAWLDWSRAMAENKMLSFVDTGQSYPEKRSAEERGDDFLEISRAYLFEKAEEQASRCSQCGRSEEHTSELQSLMRSSYAVFCLKKKKKTIVSSMITM